MNDEKKFRMAITIAHPENGATHELTLKCLFGKGKNGRTNVGIWMEVTGDCLECGELYDKTMKEGEETAWLVRWAHGMWNGKNGSWKLTEVRIEEA